MHAKQPYSDIERLARLIAALAPYEGSFELRLPGVHAVRVSHANEELTHYVQRASLGIIAQGAKVAMIGDATYSCQAGNIALYSIDVPVASRVIPRHRDAQERLAHSPSTTSTETCHNFDGSEIGRIVGRAGERELHKKVIRAALEMFTHDTPAGKVVTKRV